ncbi:hypothetical protein [Bdellovibrio svalbardensis]|uniref:SurA N-terminal domain-containing protein n=1 Tax=Bdellovibrio svalbardensis TaxID=2972972 RepID=A0ABT6DLE1_9BACT|nr:hypothetical protein [Bdellovibrio svalbardensis]MDG0817476.1 hypothetical protein [Bdellovibrio svalbardensis]
MHLLLSLLFSVHVQAAPVVTETVGQVADYVATSRELQISTVIERVVFPGKISSLEISPEQPEFRNALTALLLEIVVAMEAESFSVASVSEKDIEAGIAKVQRAVAGKAYWNQLEVSEAELKKFTTRKFVAKNFLKFKTNSMAGIVTDQEAEAYYEKNRLKFGNMPFASFKENIKTFLAQQQLEERLRNWFEVIKRKYKVRNFMADRQGT